MNVKKICLILAVALLFVGCAYAASEIGNFKIDPKYQNAYNETDYTVYLNAESDGGVTIFKNITDDSDDDDSDLYDDVVHDEWQDYILGDDDITLAKNSDNTVNFTDANHGQHGISEIVKKGDAEYIIVFWAKDGTDTEKTKLNSELQKFNKDNEFEPISF